jgi:hypothetical protein
MVRIIPGMISLLLLVCPIGASGQSFQAQGAAGPNILDTGHNLSYGIDPGFSFSAGVGISPSPRVTFLIEVERTNRADQQQVDARGGVFGFRGGTTTLAVPQVRVMLFRPDRIGPYLVGGFAAGVSRLNVTETHPETVTNDVRAIVFGGGIHVPLRRSISLFADGRFMFGGEANEIFGLSPIRAGLAWQF